MTLELVHALINATLTLLDTSFEMSHSVTVIRLLLPSPITNSFTISMFSNPTLVVMGLPSPAMSFVPTVLFTIYIVCLSMVVSALLT